MVIAQVKVKLAKKNAQKYSSIVQLAHTDTGYCVAVNLAKSATSARVEPSILHEYGTRGCGKRAERGLRKICGSPPLMMTSVATMEPVRKVAIRTTVQSAWRWRNHTANLKYPTSHPTMPQ